MTTPSAALITSPASSSCGVGSADLPVFRRIIPALHCRDIGEFEDNDGFRLGSAFDKFGRAQLDCATGVAARRSRGPCLQPNGQSQSFILHPLLAAIDALGGQEMRLFRLLCVCSPLGLTLTVAPSIAGTVNTPACNRDLAEPDRLIYGIRLRENSVQSQPPCAGERLRQRF